MESTIDLILKGHFDTLKERANRQGINLASQANLMDTLREVADYLEKDESKKAKNLRNKIVDILSIIEREAPLKIKKKPMKKAGGKKSKKQDRKAM